MAFIKLLGDEDFPTAAKPTASSEFATTEIAKLRAARPKGKQLLGLCPRDRGEDRGDVPPKEREQALQQMGPK
ncbi:MAG: hypothetical protein WD851_00400 [Pirellulales bacterium]